MTAADELQRCTLAELARATGYLSGIVTALSSIAISLNIIARNTQPPSK